MSGGRRDLNRDQRIAVMTEQGASAAEIALTLGITKRTVNRARVRMGISRPVPRPITEEEIATAAVMLADGASAWEVARTLGRDAKVFYRRFPQYKWTPAQVAEACALGRQFARLA